MAKINRLYLLIAAFIMSKTGGAIAKMDCETTDCISDMYSEYINLDYISYTDLKDDGICIGDAWTNTDEGNVTTDSVCYAENVDLRNLHFTICLDKCGGNLADCIEYIDDPSNYQCGSGGGDGSVTISCRDVGYYYYISGDDMRCQKCPDYDVFDTRNGAFWQTYVDVAKTDNKEYSFDEDEFEALRANGGNINVCYVPRGDMKYSDNSGKFVLDKNCGYSTDGDAGTI